MASVNEAERIQRLLISELPQVFTPPPGFEVISQETTPATDTERALLKVELQAMQAPAFQCSECGSTRTRSWGDYTYTLQDLPTQTHSVTLVFTGRRVGCVEKGCNKWTTNVRVSKDIESTYRQITKRLEAWMLKWAERHYIAEKDCFSRLINYPKLSYYIGMHRNSIRLMFKEWVEKESLAHSIPPAEAKEA